MNIKYSEMPNRPSNLKVENITSSFATISWSHPENDEKQNDEVLQYFIDIKDERDEEFIPIGRADGRKNTFTLEYLKPERLYRIRIRAKNSIGFSEPIELPGVIQLPKKKGRFGLL